MSPHKTNGVSAAEPVREMDPDPQSHKSVHETESSFKPESLPSKFRDLRIVDESSFPYIVEQHVTIPLKGSSGVVRCNVYRPKTKQGAEEVKFPALVTYGPYGKDIAYKE